ncbi:hypothetical protein [Gemmata sp.]|uniref:hypothetical protein n=1 Tax=Gemmata sp. TaxID=1914242 RepID=UPI003F71EFEB
MLPPAADRPKLQATFAQLSAAVEDLLLGGLTTATDATKQTIHNALQEAARFRLLRFGGTMRTVVDDLARFAKHDPTLSRRRLTLFLNRAWLQSRGLAHALQVGDEALFDRLNWTPPARPVTAVEVVCLGVAKKVTASVVIFDFRLRAVAAAGPVAAGQRLSWSAVFPVKPGQDIPPEGFLHLPQKQKFALTALLERKSITVTSATVSGDDAEFARLSLTEASTVTLNKPFADWGRFLAWSPDGALARLEKHAAGPLDLETELQEEVVLRDYEIGAPASGDEPGQTAYPIIAGHLTLHAVVGAGVEGKALKKGLDDLRKLKKGRPPLFGLMHYERCRLVFQPLATFPASGPDYVTISKESVNKATLLKALNFN